MPESDLAAEAASSANLIDERVGERLRRRRISLGITHTELADAAESTVQQVRQWEDGISRIEAIQLRKLAQILGVNSSFFFAVERPEQRAFEQGVFAINPRSVDAVHRPHRESGAS